MFVLYTGLVGCLLVYIVATKIREYLADEIEALYEYIEEEIDDVYELIDRRTR